MRSKLRMVITDHQVQAYAEARLVETLAFQDVGWKCTARTVWRILLLAATRITSIYAACRDLAKAPSDDAVMNALDKWLPKRTQTLEARFAPVLAGQWLPKALFRKARVVAIDWHSIPYHGEPQRWSNELRHSKPKSGTTKSHTYATACIVHKGFRYTLAVTSVKQNESAVQVTKRLLDRLKALGLRLKTLLLDRQFSTSIVMAELQSRHIPYVMPLMFRGRKPLRRKTKSGRPRPVTLRDFRSKHAGRYRFTWSGPQASRQTVAFDVVVAYKSYHHKKTGRRQSKKMLFAAWKVPGSPREIRELYRCRFAIEATYRQLGQARVRTSTRSPVIRLLFVLIALVLRNLWVWLHWMAFAERDGNEVTKQQLDRLRFRRLLDWIARVITQSLHDGTAYYT